MSAIKTAWHPPFTGLLRERCPKWVRITAEVQLTTEPLRVDDLLEVWSERPHDAQDRGATLRTLWGFLVRVGLLEFKSIARPFRHGDLYRLLAYGSLWLAAHQATEEGPRLDPSEVTLILAVPSINKALRDELGALGAAITDAAEGYRVVRALAMPLLVVDLGVVAEREDDDLLRWFAGHRLRTLEALRWVRQHQGARSDDMGTNATPDLEGYDEWVAQYVASLAPEQLAHTLAGLAPEQRLAGLAPEQRLAGLAPEQRLAGLSESEQVLSLPDRLLRLLPESYVETLPEPTRARVRARRGG